MILLYPRYDKAMDGMADILLKKSNPSGLTYVSDWNGHRNEDKVLFWMKKEKRGEEWVQIARSKHVSIAKG